MSSGSPSSIKSFYKATIHNNNSTSSTSSSKRPLDSNNNHSVKIPKTFDGDNAVITLGDSDDEDSPIDGFASIRGVSTPSPGALSVGVDHAFNTPKDASKSNLFKIFFLISRNSEPLRSAFNSLSREIFNPCWIDFTEIDTMISTHKDPILVVDSFESDQFSHFKSKKELKIFSAFALVSINPRRPRDLISFQHSRIASVCMKKVSITCSGISDYKEIVKRVRAMGGSFGKGLYSKTTHIIAENWNSEKVKYFRKLNKPVMRPEWVHRCWEMKEDIRDLGELDKFALPVFSGMNICVSGFDQQMRTKMKKNVIEHGGNWQRGLMLGRYDFETEDTISTQIDKNMRTTHLVVATKTTDKYKSAMSDPDVKIVNVDWFNASLTNRVPQMEEDPKYCERDENALNELKRVEREIKKRRLQTCSQISRTQNNSLPVLTPKKDVENYIANLCSTTMISSTDVFKEISFCFCGLDLRFHKNLKNLISRVGGIVYNELVSAVTHVIIGPNMTSRDAYNINRHEEKYRKIEKVNLDWVVQCCDTGVLFPTPFDNKLENILNHFKCTQDLPPNVAKEIVYERALERADEFAKEVDIAEKLNHSFNFYNKDINNNQNSSQSVARMCAIPESSKLKITENHCSQKDITQSIPVGWGSQN